MRIPVGLRETMPWSTKRGGGNKVPFGTFRNSRSCLRQDAKLSKKFRDRVPTPQEEVLQNEVVSSSVKKGMTTREKGKVYGTFKPSCISTSTNCNTLHHRLWSVYQHSYCTSIQCSLHSFWNATDHGHTFMLFSEIQWILLLHSSFQPSCRAQK